MSDLDKHTLEVQHGMAVLEFLSYLGLDDVGRLKVLVGCIVGLSVSRGAPKNQLMSFIETTFDKTKALFDERMSGSGLN